jgi:hypothetical protein
VVAASSQDAFRARARARRQTCAIEAVEVALGGFTESVCLPRRRAPSSEAQQCLVTLL